LGLAAHQLRQVQHRLVIKEITPHLIPLLQTQVVKAVFKVVQQIPLVVLLAVLAVLVQEQEQQAKVI
jgi:hypothetical protein